MRSTKLLRLAAATRVASLSAPISASSVSAVAGPSMAAAAPAAALRRGYSDMFCYQCEQTKDTKGCTTVGVCGKTPEVATLQDLLMEGLKAVAQYSHRSAKMGVRDTKVDAWVKQALFSTLTNVNFDADRFRTYLLEAVQMRDAAKTLYLNTCKSKGVAPESLSEAASFSISPSDSIDALVKQGEAVGVLSRRAKYGDTLAGLMELCTYGLKGMAAYAEHAHVYGRSDAAVDAFTHEVLDALATDKPSVNQFLGLALAVGTHNVRVMDMLEESHTSTFGHPEPTKVVTSAVKGKCVLVSGHDIRDLEEVLKQTAGKGINVYTHGELLPAHGYPKLKKTYPHLVGNYGSAWQNQQLEFSLFPGPILMTTNCLVEPRKGYKERIFTRSVVGFPGVKHIDSYDFKQVVDSALAMDGFAKTEPETSLMTGFGQNAVLSNAGAVVDAVKTGAIKHFFVIGGCDGAESERSYFRDLANAVPKDAMILTLGCGKFRFIKQFEKFGKIGAFPRVLDVGQCNDAIGAVKIASALANAFKTDVNGLPLSFAISWFEQKAVAVLLSLLSLGVKNIHLGPRLPAFITPEALGVLVEKFNIKPTGSAEADLKNDFMPSLSAPQ